MAIVLRVVSAEEGPGAFAVFAVEVAHLAEFAVLGQDDAAGLDGLAAESGGLAHEAPDDAGVVLCEHGGHPVPLGGEVEEDEEVVLFVDQSLAGAVVDIDGRDLVFLGVGADAEVFEGEAAAVVEHLLGVGLHGVAVEHDVADVDPFGGEGYVVTVGRGAHGEEEAAAHDKVADFLGHGEFELADFAEAQPVGRSFLQADILDIPLLRAVGAPELAILAGEVLVVEVEPVVGGQDAGDNLVVVDHVVGHLGIGEDEGDGVVPREFVFGRVDSYLGGFLQLDGIHVDRRVGDMGEDGGALPVGDDLAGDAAQAAFALDGVGIFGHERAAAVVEQPGNLGFTLQGPEGDAVGLEVVLLRLVHRHHYVRRIRVRDKKKGEKDSQHLFEAGAAEERDMRLGFQFSILNLCADRGTRTPTPFGTRS